MIELSKKDIEALPKIKRLNIIKAYSAIFKSPYAKN